MKKISRSTLLYKWLFPVLWFGFLAFFIATGLTRGRMESDQWIFFLIPCVVGVVGFVIMRKFVWDLMDEVQDGGDYLLVRKGSEEQRIPLSNIMNVNITLHVNPQRITLRLVEPGRFGPEVSFTPLTRFGFFRLAKNPIAEDLIVRAYEARTRRG